MAPPRSAPLPLDPLGAAAPLPGARPDAERLGPLRHTLRHPATCIGAVRLSSASSCDLLRHRSADLAAPAGDSTGSRRRSAVRH